MIPGSRRNLFKDQSFGESDNAGIKAVSAVLLGKEGKVPVPSRMLCTKVTDVAVFTLCIDRFEALLNG